MRRLPVEDDEPGGSAATADCSGPGLALARRVVQLHGGVGTAARPPD